MLSSILSARAGATADRSNQDDGQNHVRDMSTKPLVEEEPNLRELNNALRALVELFPDVRPEVFREMLTRVSAASRLEIVSDQLIKNDAHYVQGRYRRRETNGKNVGGVKSSEGADTHGARDISTLPREETFRNEKYKITVKKALYDEFRSLSHATIKAVLAECNHYYSPARIALLGIASKSWRASFTKFFLRWKTPSPDANPFLSWTVPKDGIKDQKFPKLISTQNSELDQELYETLVLPALVQLTEAQKIVDHALAHQLAETEAQEVGEEYDCEVCYSTVTINEIAVCDGGGHIICFRCIVSTVNEAIFGQGWTRSISTPRGTMKCVAPILDGSGDCDGCVDFEIVRLAMQGKEIRGESPILKFEQRLSSNALTDTRLELAHCPFCSYAEVDDLTITNSFTWRFRDPREMRMMSVWLLMLLLPVGGILLLLPLLALIYLGQYLPFSVPAAMNPFSSTLHRLALKSRGFRFTCRSTACSKRSCLRCHTLWQDPHVCFEKSLSSLQKSIEAAQTSAIKRVCPRCNLSFVKSSGCNKLVCPCGYSMCYLCRAELLPSGVPGGGYEHFCQHFRLTGGRCTECDKCDLYREEDEKEVLKMARESAEKDWREGEGKGVKLSGKDVEALFQENALWEWRTWKVWLDALVERFVIVQVD